MIRDYNSIEAIVIKKKGTIKYVNCNYKTLYRLKPNGNERWNEYDVNGNMAHEKHSDGIELWQEYNDHGNMIHYKDSDGIEHYYDYDEFRNIIHSKFSNGIEYWYKYNEDHCIIDHKTNEDEILNQHNKEELQSRLEIERSKENLIVCSIEEMSELIKVLTKYLRNSEKFSMDNLTEETAHVLLMVDTIKDVFDLKSKDIEWHQLDALKRCFNIE